MFTALLQGLCSRRYETVESEDTLQLITFMFTPRIAQLFWLVLGIRGKLRLLLTDASRICRMPAWKCLQLSPWLGAVCIFSCTWAGMYLHSLVLNNACTDFVCSFPPLSNGCMVTVHVRRALHWLHWFPALLHALHRLHTSLHVVVQSILIQTQFFFS